MAGGVARGKRKARGLDYCSTCGALCHAGCMEVRAAPALALPRHCMAEHSRLRSLLLLPVNCPAPPLPARPQEGEEGAGSLACALCVAGLQDVESFLGCRLAAVGKEGAREYFVKFKGRSHRRASLQQPAFVHSPMHACMRSPSDCSSASRCADTTSSPALPPHTNHRRRSCRWVSERAAARMAPQQLQRFVRDTRDAPSVEPNVQAQWLQARAAGGG